MGAKAFSALRRLGVAECTIGVKALAFTSGAKASIAAIGAKAFSASRHLGVAKRTVGTKFKAFAFTIGAKASIASIGAKAFSASRRLGVLECTEAFVVELIVAAVDVVEVVVVCAAASQEPVSAAPRPRRLVQAV